MHKPTDEEIVKLAIHELLKGGFIVTGEDGDFSITDLGWAQLEYELFLQQDRKPS